MSQWVTKPDLQYLETAGRWPSATHVPPLAGSASLIPPETSPKAPAAPACVPLQRTQNIINVCARAASFITEQRPPGGHYFVLTWIFHFACSGCPERRAFRSRVLRVLCTRKRWPGIYSQSGPVLFSYFGTVCPSQFWLCWCEQQEQQQ